MRPLCGSRGPKPNRRCEIKTFDTRAILVTCIIWTSGFAGSVRAYADNLYVQVAPDGVQATAFVDCKINGRSAHCPLDTGSTFPVASAPMGLLKHTTIIGREDAVGLDSVSMPCDIVSISGLLIGTKNTGVKEAWRCPNFPAVLSPNIGNSIFNGSAVTLDFPNQKMFWNQPQDLDKRAKLTMSRNTQTGWIIIDAKIGNKRLSAFFDTGSHISAIDKKYVAAHPSSFIFFQKDRATDATGKITEEKIYATEPISVDGKIFRSVGSNCVVSADFTYIQKFLGPNVHLILGMNDIKELTWFFNFKNNTWGVAQGRSAAKRGE